MNVLISIPTTGYIHKHVEMAVERIRSESRHRITVMRPTHRPYENNLHHIVNDFMAGPWDYWLNIDSDNPPTKNPLDLVALDLDIVGCPTPVWHFTGENPGERPYYWNAYRINPEADAYNEWLPQEGLQEVDAVGTGCILIHRRVFEDRWMREAPFQRTCNADGTVDRGNDIAFCERAKRSGFRIWAHFDYPCRHFHELELVEVIHAFSGVERG